MNQNIPIGYIYLITNKINNKTYVGQRKLSKDKSWRSYMGSGVAIKLAISKYGKNNFTKSLLQYAYSQNDLNNLEIEYINSYGFNDKDKSYNLTNNLSGGDTFSKIPSDRLDLIKKKQSIGQKTSSKVKSFRIKEKEDRRILRNKYRDVVIEEYSVSLNMKKVSEAVGISVKLVSEILKENEIQVNHQNVSGLKTASLNSNIKRSIKAKSNYYYPDGLNAIEKHDELLSQNGIFISMTNNEISEKYCISLMSIKTFKMEHGLTKTKRECYICLSRNNNDTPKFH